MAGGGGRGSFRLVVDRERIRRWLSHPPKSWRWNDADDADGYDAVEATAQGLRWFRWTHAFRSDGQHGEYDVELQSYSKYVSGGPLRDLPEAVRAELDELARERLLLAVGH